MNGVLNSDVTTLRIDALSSGIYFVSVGEAAAVKFVIE